MDFDLAQIEGFDWDKGNINKNLKKHKVTDKESEEVFSNAPFISEDIKHSDKEERFHALGKTNKGRLLFISFTLREIDKKYKIRIISARDVNRKEATGYEKAQKNT